MGLFFCVILDLQSKRKGMLKIVAQLPSKLSSMQPTNNLK